MAFVNTSFLLLLCFFFTTHTIRSPSPSFNLISTNNTILRTPKGDSWCIFNLEKSRNDQSNCIYSQYCTSQGYVNNLYIFYCLCGSYPCLGYTLLTLWLLVLLYLLANTASQYFWPSVERLSRELRLSPTTSDVALLYLGNGLLDVLASISSFRSASLGEVGLSSVLSTSKDAHQGKKKDDPPRYYIKKFKAKPLLFYIWWILDLIQMALYLPRRLTLIPDVSEERWSKSFAVASATFSPLLVTTLWNSKMRTKMGTSKEEEALAIYILAIFVGIILGAIALKTTNKDWPPKKGLLFPWLAMGFLITVLWTCVIAEELVGLLVSLGFVFGINPSILGLTVLAWGNSIGDMIANVAMAVSWGQGGAQIAISGFYAGPIFNALAGLGSSLVVSAWSAHPKPFVIPVGPQLFEILGFMICGLIWALVVLPKREMKLDTVLAIGLQAVYSCFLSLRLSQSLGLVKI